MRTLSSCVLIALIAIGTGCPRTAPDKKVVETIVNAFRVEFEKDQQRYDCYVRGFDFQEQNGAIACLTSASADRSKYADDARRIRDQVTGRFVRVIDNNYEQFTNDLQNHRATANFLGDITELGVGAAVGITNGERALQILGVALTAFRGGRKSIDQNFYERQSTPILITKMDTSRDRVMSAMLQKRQNFGVDRYSLEDALGDVIKYFWAGTLTRAFVELSKDASVQAKIAETQLLEVQDVHLETIPSLKRQQFSGEITALRIALAKQFREAEAITVMADKDSAVKKVTAKFELIWSQVEAKDDFKAIVKALKDDADLAAIIGKINATDSEPSKKEVYKLFDRLNELITKADDDAGNTKLQEAFLDIVKKASQ